MLVHHYTGRLAAVGGASSCGRKQNREKQRTQKSKTGKRVKLILGSWNVRTLLDNDYNRPERQTALVAMELERYGIIVI